MARRLLMVLIVIGSLACVACGGSNGATTGSTPDSAGATSVSTSGSSETGTTTAAPYRGDRASTGATTDPQTTTSALPAAGSRTRQSLKLASGRTLDYTLVLPASYRAGAKSPVLVALPPGGQGQPEVDALLDKWWAAEGGKRGWIVVSPVAPGGELFFSDSSDTLVALMDAVAKAYPPEGGGFHLAGVSNGGLSAYRIALDEPKRFLSLLVAPGFPPDDADRAKLTRLVKIPVASYVGENDSSWREGSLRTVTELKRLGGQATLTVSPGEDHILQRITAKQLYDVLDATRPGR
jgi:predicted esterase